MSSIVFAQFVARAYLPCVVLAIGAAFAWRMLGRGALRTSVRVLAALLLFVPQLLSLFLANDSVELLAYQRLTLAFWGYAMTALLLYRLWRGPGPSAQGAARADRAVGRRRDGEPMRNAVGMLRMRPTGRWGPGKLALTLCFTVPLSGYASWYLVGDYLLPPLTVEGYAERAAYHPGTRSLGWYELFVAGKGYAVTRDVLATMHPGEAIRARVGAGSGTILSYARLESGKR